MAAPRIVLFLCLIFTAASFLLGINWGLPSRDVDKFLFGERTPWTGAEILQLVGTRDAGAGVGADVDRNPVGKTNQAILLNATDAQRAEIVGRYRLYSYQPDEMITFMSLAQMKPRQWGLDPKLYQYGGLWVYPVGGLLHLAGKLGLIELRSDLGYYLDHPESFGRFYIVARAYSAAYGVIGAICVWWLVRRYSASTAAAAFATISYAMLPVVNNMAHEAKPHLPGAVLMLLAVIAAIRFVETGRRRWWIAAGATCGAATGMILSAEPICIILPIMVLLRRMAWGARTTIFLAAGVIAVDMYAITNPYVVKHLINWNLAENPLRSNLANSKAMYSAGLSLQSTADAASLLGSAATWAIIVAGLIGLIAVLLKRQDTPAVPAVRPVDNDYIASEAMPRIVPLLLAPAIIILTQFAVLAEGKPGEYARFALFPSLVLLLLAYCGVSRLVRHRTAAGVVIFLLTAATAVHGVSYVWHFLLDSKPRTTRIIAADRLESARVHGARSVGVQAEPAPYALPPMNLWDWELWYSPRRLKAGNVACDLWIEAVDIHPAVLPRPGTLPADAPVFQRWIRPKLLRTPISWATKPFLVQGRPELFAERQ